VKREEDRTTPGSALHLAGKEDFARKRRQQPSLHLRSQSESETLILERDCLRHVSTCYWTVKLVNWSTLVKWSKSAVNFCQNCKNG